MSRLSYTERKNREIEILEKYGAENIESYVLISNYGYTFTRKGYRYDARFWANCYGCAIDRWSVHRIDDDAPLYKLFDRLEKELNRLQ